MSWVNIWRDAEAAEYVEGHRDGNQTVPTAITGAGDLIPATPEAIRGHLGSAR